MASSAGDHDAAPGPELDHLRSRADDEAPLPSAQEQRELLAGVQQRIRGAERSPGWWLRARRTAVRRALALVSFALLASLAWWLLRRPDWPLYPTARMAASLGAMAVLLTASLLVAVRPLHRPPPPRWLTGALVVLSLLSTLVLALLPAAHTLSAEAVPQTPLYQHASKCLSFGLLAGWPVYAIARLLDRGSMLTPLLAAAAAGLAGNFILQLHCPITLSHHRLAGHFTVALAFVGGVLLLERIGFRRRR